MERFDKDEVSMRTFNTAKKFADEVLFRLLLDFKKFQRQANFGTDELKDAAELTEELRDIERFNGLKGMAVTSYDLLQAISSTVICKNNKGEIASLKEYLKITNSLLVIINNNKERFFDIVHREGKTLEAINRAYFEKIKEIIEVCYINTEILMNKNKILFDSSGDDFLSDAEMREAIRQEYIEN